MKIKSKKGIEQIILIIGFLTFLICMIASCQNYKAKQTVHKFDKDGILTEVIETNVNKDGSIDWSNKERVFDIRILSVGR